MGLSAGNLRRGLFLESKSFGTKYALFFSEPLHAPIIL